jgi:hypothetical protein
VPRAGSDFADFATATALRYPWVKHWLIWNEPNQRRWLVPPSPRLYVTRLLNPAYGALKRASPGSLVAGGVTAPRASSGGVGPLEWLAGMRSAGARLDAYAHHPYPSSPAETPLAGGCPHCRTVTMATMERLLRAVGRSFTRARVWLTEYGYQTRPPDPFGVTPALQARYVGEAAMRAHALPRVDMLIQFLYKDEPDIARFQSGLVALSGKAKPALAAFRMPLAQVSRTGTRVTVWGQLRCGSGSRPYRLQVRTGGTWRWRTSTFRTSPRGFFRHVVVAPAGSQVRAWSAACSYSLPLLVR